MRTPDRPYTLAEFQQLRQKSATLSVTELYDAYHAAWLKCKAERDGRMPPAATIQKLVQLRKELRNIR